VRLLAVRTLKLFWERYPDAEGSLRAWYQEAVKAKWQNPGQMKAQYTNASVITSKRVVFNIKGNSYRLIVDIEYKLQIIFIVWVGSHMQYERINAKTKGYGKADKE
jgi:mRNA interferase HigB